MRETMKEERLYVTYRDARGRLYARVAATAKRPVKNIPACKKFTDRYKSEQPVLLIVVSIPSLP